MSMGRLRPMLYGHTVSSSLYAAAFLLVWYQDILGADYLETTREHPTGRLWVDCLIKPTPLALMFLFGERNGDFLLQKHCLKEMLPYFFAAGHQNYARYQSWYVRQMEHLPQIA